MIINHDSFKNTIPPDYILCKANGDRLGIIFATDKSISLKFNSYCEITFITYLYIDGVKNSLYDKIVGLQYVELPLIGRFVINDVTIHSEATDFEYKECKALSEEVLLAQKYLEDFTINMGTTESIDNVRFYHQSDPSKSLLHLILDKCPDWTIGHIDRSLMGLERCFKIDRQDIYSTLTNTVAEAFQCVFLFDTVNHRINVYAEDTVGNDTNIFISYENLLKNTELSYSIENIKTCLTVTGADDLSLREVNMGYKALYNIEYFNSLEYMSQQLYNEYNAWTKKWNNNVDRYESLMLQYQQFYNRIHELESTKMPSTPGSTNWAEYGLNPLKEQLEIYQQKHAVMMKSGQGDPSHKDYTTVYLPCYNTIKAIQSQISVIENQLSSLHSQQNSIGNQMNSIINDISMEKNFSVDSLKELSKWIREDELTSDNFIVVDTMTDTERMDMLKEMLEYGRKELSKISQPELEFRSDIVNLYNLPEFQELSPDFEPGNYIHVYIRDDYIVKARILTIDVDWLNPENFTVTFGNIMKLKGSEIMENVTNALGLAQSAATSVSMNSSNWNKANKEASDIMEMLSDGLAAAGQAITTSAADVLIDDRGILVSNIPESLYPNDRIFIGGSQILFSDDDFKTVRTGIGRLTYTKKGVTYNDFGVLADFVIAGYIAGSTIEGDEIIGGTITGSDFNNGNGTFHVDSSGNLIASSADVTGTIKADKGYIGGPNGFTIESEKLYSGKKSTFESNIAGVYLGTDGIKLGDTFSVNKNGYIISTNGKIGGFTITDTYIANGATSLSGANNSVYLGIDGISLGTTFEVTKKGALTSTSGKIASFVISNDTLTSGNIGICSNTKVGTIAFWAGNSARDSAPFRVTNEGKVTCNDIDITGGSLKIGDNFKVKNDGSLTASNATITGTIKADKGYIGGTNGFTIESGKLYSGNKSSLNSTLSGVYLGTDGISLGNSFKATNQGKLTCNDIDITGGSITVGDHFSVDSSGSLVASSAEITGIIKANTGYIGGTSGFTIKSGKLYSNNKSSLTSSLSGIYLGTDGISLGTKFKVTNDGSLTSSSAEITGTIKAETGYIGGANGWTIKSKAMYTGNKSSLSSSNTGAYLGADGISIGSSLKYIKYSVSQGELQVKGDIYADYIEAGNGMIGDWKIEEGRLESTSARSIIKGGTITGSVINGSTINGSNIYGGDEIPFEASSEGIYLGNFVVTNAAGNNTGERHYFESINQKVGMSSTADNGLLYLWAGWHSSNCYGNADAIFEVNDSLVVVGGGNLTIWGERGSIEVYSTLFNLLDKIGSGSSSGCNCDDDGCSNYTDCDGCPDSESCTTVCDNCSEESSCGPGICPEHR